MQFKVALANWDSRGKKILRKYKEFKRLDNFFLNKKENTLYCEVDTLEEINVIKKITDCDVFLDLHEMYLTIYSREEFMKDTLEHSGVNPAIINILTNTSEEEFKKDIEYVS